MPLLRRLPSLKHFTLVNSESLHRAECRANFAGLLLQHAATFDRWRPGW